MDLAIQRLNDFREQLNPHFVGFLSCIYLFDIPPASGKISMQKIHIGWILITRILPPALLLEFLCAHRAM